MHELKTRETAAGVESFLDDITDERRRADCFTLLDMSRQATGAGPAMTGSSIVSSGRTHDRYAGGHQGGWFCVGIAPRGRNLSLSLACGRERHTDLPAKPGRHRTGRSCLYVNRRQDIDPATLCEQIERSARPAAARTPNRSGINRGDTLVS